MTGNTALHLFQGHGVELEYMIVAADTLDVLPRTDEVLRAVAGDYVNEVERGPLCWSNELMLHVIEFKTNGPVARLAGLEKVFGTHVREVNRLLAPLGGRLMPSGMHPWMHPDTEATLWPHGYSPIYAAFDRIFDCRGHGWSNLQSLHLNLPFEGDDEFGRLHAAIRLVLPILPALAASSPIVEGQVTSHKDHRLDVYRFNAARIPSITGEVVPEPVFTIDDYHRVILHPMYGDIAPHDPESILQYEWLNARGAIARFERNTIEVRVIDVQESPRVDLAVASLAVAAIRACVEQRWADFERQKAWPTPPLAALVSACGEAAEEARVPDGYLDMFGYAGTRPATARHLWAHLYERLIPELPADEQETARPAEAIIEEGSLATRILDATGSCVSRGRLHEVYSRLCDCLENNVVFSNR